MNVLKVNEELIKLLSEYDECADELIDFGDSNEKAHGHGMRVIIEVVKGFINKIN